MRISMKAGVLPRSKSSQVMRNCWRRLFGASSEPF